MLLVSFEVPGRKSRVAVELLGRMERLSRVVGLFDISLSLTFFMGPRDVDIA